MIWILLLFSLLDFQRPPVPDDDSTHSFVVSELQELSMTGCASNPQGPSLVNNGMIEVIWVGEDGNVYSGHVTSGQLPVNQVPSDRYHAGFGLNDMGTGTIQRVMRPPGEPDPFPEPELHPIATTPEPAILVPVTIIAIGLFALYYLRKQKWQKLVRRH